MSTTNAGMSGLGIQARPVEASWRPAVPLADRLAVSLVNRKQLAPSHFESGPGGSCLLNQRGRHIVLNAYRVRMAEMIMHPVLNQRLPWRLILHAQARLLARHLRGDTPAYLPFAAR